MDPPINRPGHTHFCYGLRAAHNTRPVETNSPCLRLQRVRTLPATSLFCNLQNLQTLQNHPAQPQPTKSSTTKPETAKINSAGCSSLRYAAPLQCRESTVPVTSLWTPLAALFLQWWLVKGYLVIHFIFSSLSEFQSVNRIMELMPAALPALSTSDLLRILQTVSWVFYICDIFFSSFWSLQTVTNIWALL